MVAPKEASAWAQDRSALWNAAEGAGTRKSSVTARELALPPKLEQKPNQNLR
ncbi:MAG: MobA/MobL family protein [Pseudomonadota bacterium]